MARGPGACGEGAPQGGAAARALAVVLCGVPAAGKSTLAVGLERAAGAGGIACLRVSFDEVVAAGATESEPPPDFDPVEWRRERVVALGQVEAALQKGGASAGLALPGAGSPGLVVIVDDNMFYRSMRRVIFRMCRQHASAFLVVHLRVSPGVAVERNRARAGRARVPDAAFQRMVAAFQPPASGGCGWERHALEVDASVPVDPDAVWERVRGAWGPAPPPAVTAEARAALREAGLAGNLSSLVHAYDLWSRKAVRACVQSLENPRRRGEAAGRLNSARAELLQRVRHSAMHTAKDPDELLESFCLACECESPGAALPPLGTLG